MLNAIRTIKHSRILSQISVCVLLAFCSVIFLAEFLHDDPVEFFKPENPECIACQFAHSSFIPSYGFILFHEGIAQYLSTPARTDRLTVQDWASDYRVRAPPQVPTTT
ncbi:hypothetical protein ACFLT7_04210 [candidate division KSB1 bacterium]